MQRGASKTGWELIAHVVLWFGLYAAFVSGSWMVSLASLVAATSIYALIPIELDPKDPVNETLAKLHRVKLKSQARSAL